MPRAYDNSRRALAAERTRDALLDAAEALLVQRPLGEVTLRAIAEGAGVTVQTALRHLGSREGCFESIRARVLLRVEAQRGDTPSGDVDAALDDLLAHYESEGRLILSMLTQEAVEPFARDAAAEGRAFHRAWVVRCFGPLSDLDDPTRVDALVAATDLYVWKLLRLDLERDPQATRDAVERLVRAVLETP